MKTTHKILFSTALMLATTLGAQVPSIINYQGRVSVSGVNYNGVGQFKFALVNSSQTLWNNDGFTTANEPSGAVAATVTKGLYSIGLGDTTQQNMAALPSTVFTNSDVRLRVWFFDGTSFQQLTPDQRIYAVGYALNAANVADGAVTSAKIATGAIQQSHLAAGVGGGGTVNDGGITTAKIADAAVTSAKISSGSITGGHLNLSGLATTLWQVGGNAGTAAGTHFLGTTDNQSLELKINNARALRLNPGASSGAANLVVGGMLNGTDANVQGSSIAGGVGNVIADGANFAFIGSGQSNAISTNATLSVLGGGISNLVTSSVAFLGGGFNNVVSGFESAVVAGEGNVVSGGGSFVGGGITNLVTGGDAVIVGGGLNVASGLYSFIGAGVFNGATNIGSAIVGGSSNVAWGIDASIVGGSSNFLHTNATVAVISVDTSTWPATMRRLWSPAPETSPVVLNHSSAAAKPMWLPARSPPSAAVTSTAQRAMERRFPEDSQTSPPAPTPGPVEPLPLQPIMERLSGPTIPQPMCSAPPPTTSSTSVPPAAFGSPPTSTEPKVHSWPRAAAIGISSAIAMPKKTSTRSMRSVCSKR